MDTPSRDPLGAMFAQLSALVWHTCRTTPGLVLITVGSLAACLGHPWWGLAGAGLGAMLYAEHCSRTPYAPCYRCAGTGHHHKHRSRACRPCRGKGVRMRWGRAVMNTYRRATYSTTAAPAARPARPLAPGTYDDTQREQIGRR
jgi:hypothetical protein